MTRLEVEIDDFVFAAHLLHDHVTEPVRVASEHLANVLADCGGMAGDDEGGASWAMAYDDAADAVVRATNRLLAAAAITTKIFGRAAANYAIAEAASTPGTSATIEQRLPATEGVVAAAPSLPSAAGSGSTEPTLWHFVKHLVGYAWPSGHQDRLRHAASGYRRCALVLDDAASRPAVIMMSFAMHRYPELDDIVTVCNDLSDRTKHLARSHRQLAEACEQLAAHIDTCHSQITDELVSLTEQTAVIETLGGIASLFTFGTAEVPTQAVEGSRIAATAAKITMIITRLYEAMRTIRATMPALTAAVETDIVALDRISKIETIAADVRQAGTTNRVTPTPPGSGATDAVTAAARRLQAAGTNERIKRPLNKHERKHILDGDGPGSGGHRYSDDPEDTLKSMFPKSWSDEQIITNVEDIVRAESTVWRVQSGNGGLWTKSGKPAVWRAWEIRDHLSIRVVWEPATGHVRTAFPEYQRYAKGEIVR